MRIAFAVNLILLLIEAAVVGISILVGSHGKLYLDNPEVDWLFLLFLTLVACSICNVFYFKKWQQESAPLTVLSSINILTAFFELIYFKPNNYTLFSLSISSVFLIVIAINCFILYTVRNQKTY